MSFKKAFYSAIFASLTAVSFSQPVFADEGTVNHEEKKLQATDSKSTKKDDCE